MKNWTLAVILLVRKLSSIYELIDKKIERVSLRFGADTLKQYDTILKLTDKKDMLHNIEVIYDKMVELTSVKDMEFLYDYLILCGEAMVDKYQISRQAIWQKAKRKIDKASKAFVFFALDDEFMNKNYSHFPIVKHILARVEKK